MRTSASPTPQGQRQSAEAAPLTPEKVAKQKDPAAREVLSFLRLVQLGAWPLALESFDPRVLETVGADTLISTLAGQRPVIRNIEPEIVDVEQTGGTRLVTVLIRPSNSPEYTTSFVMGRRQGDFEIRYDTLVGDSLAGQVESDTQAAVDPAAKEPSRRAVLAGKESARRYRTLFTARDPATAG